MGELSVADKFRGVQASRYSVWVGNIAHKDRGSVHGLSQIAAPKGYEAITEQDRKDIGTIRDHFADAIVGESVTDRTTEELLQAGYVGIYRLRSRVGLDAQAA